MHSVTRCCKSQDLTVVISKTPKVNRENNTVFEMPILKRFINIAVGKLSLQLLGYKNG